MSLPATGLGTVARLPGGPWRLQAPRGVLSVPRSPGRGQCHRRGQVRAAACSQLVRTEQQTLNFGLRTGASSCLQVLGGTGELGGHWEPGYGGCTGWFHISPLLPSSSSPRGSCSHGHSCANAAPNPGGRQWRGGGGGLGVGRRGAERGQRLLRMGLPKGEARPVQNHSPAPGRQRGGRISPSSHPHKTKAFPAAPGSDKAAHKFQVQNGKNPNKITQTHPSPSPVSQVGVPTPAPPAT